MFVSPAVPHVTLAAPARKAAGLGPGARLAVVAPASAFDRAAFHAGLAELRLLGFETSYDESVFERDRYLAGRAGGARGRTQSGVA